MQLMQMGLVTDPIYILENIELPGKEKLIKMIMEQQSQQAQAMEPMSDEEMAGMGTDEDEIMRKLEGAPDMMNRIPEQYRT